MRKEKHELRYFASKNDKRLGKVWRIKDILTMLM